MGIEIQVNSLEEMCDLMCDNKLPDNTKMTIEQAKLQLNDLLEYCAESGKEWENDKQALQVAIRSIEALGTIRKEIVSLIDFNMNGDYISEAGQGMQDCLEIIDKTLEGVYKDDNN